MTFIKGKSGNPGGRPKRNWSWAEAYQQVLEKKTADKIPIYIGVAEVVVDKALQGDILAVKELSNRMDGMPKQQTELSGSITQITIKRSSK